MAINPQIVTVNVSLTLPASPSQLQQTGAIVSQGATTLTAGTYALLTSAQSLASYIASPGAISSISWSSSTGIGIVTVGTSAPHNLPLGTQVWVTVAGVAPAGYNGTFYVTPTGASTFTYPLVTNPGSETTLGTWAPDSIAWLNAANASFFNQGGNVPVYVLELGAGNATTGTAALATWITANSSPQFFYSYRVPKHWDGHPAFISFLANYESPSAKTYFLTASSLGTYGQYTNLMKDLFWLVPAPALGTWPSNIITQLIAEPAAPTLSASGSGHTLPAGTYYVVVTYMTAYGETLASPESNQIVTTAQELTINSPAALTGATGWNAYVSSTSGTETLQVAGTAIGTPVNITAPLSSTGASPPTYGVGVFTTTTAHGIVSGQTFQTSGFLPIAYNSWWAAQPGTSGETLVVTMTGTPFVAIGPETQLGSLDALFCNQSAALSTEDDLSAVFYNMLAINPSPGTPAAPLQWRYLYGITPWSQQGVGTILSAILAANGNYVWTGFQGGISEAILMGGITADGNQFVGWWYSADWAQINYKLAVTNAMINGSNNPNAPLYLNQQGINTLQDVMYQVSVQAVQYGLANGSPGRSALSSTALAIALEQGTYDGVILVNAVPFNIYYTGTNAGQYQQGIYNGYAIQYIPQTGFENVTINLNITGFPAGQVL